MPEADVARVARLFDAVATTYDSVGVDFFQPIAASLCAAMPAVPGERWWDVGCGGGAVIDQVAGIIGADGEVIGTDISPVMLEQARARGQVAGWSNVTLVHDDAQSPTRAPSPVDTVSSCLVLFFLPRPVAALRSWAGSLRPGGRIGVTTFGPVDPGWTNVDTVFEPYLPPMLKDARTSGAEGPFASDAGMARLLADAGFTQVRTVSHEVEVRFDDADQWHAFTWSTGQRAMWLSVPEDERAQVRTAAEERLAAVADADGVITFTQQIRHTLALKE